MDMPTLSGPNGRPIDPAKVFVEDGHGNTSQPLAQKDQKDFALPTYLTVASIISGAQKTYLANQFDEALKHSYVNARSMIRDCRILGWLEERIESVVNLKWHLEILNEKDMIQVAVRDGLTTAFRQIPHFKRILRGMQKWALWGGRGCSHVCWDWCDIDLPKVPQKNLFEEMAGGGQQPPGMMYGDDFGGAEPDKPEGLDGGEGGDGGGMGGEQQDPNFGKKPEFPLESRPVLMPIKNRPVNGDKINYTWGWEGNAPPGTPLVKVHGAAGLDIPGAEIVYDNIGPNVLLTGEWRERFIIHTYDPDDADYYAPEMAGGIHGVGIRSRIYWVNWLRQEYASWIQDLYDRLGLGFIIIKYDLASNQAKLKAEETAKKWNRRSVLTVPVTADQLQRAGTIEVIEAPTSGAVVVQELVKYFDKQIERYILRQTVSGGGGAQGDGMRGTSGPTEMAKKTDVQRIKADAEELAETITGSYEEPGILSTMMRWTYPGLWDDQKKQFKFPVKFVFEVEDESPKDKLQSVTMAAGLGVKFKADEVRGLTGMAKPDPGDETVGGEKGGGAMMGGDGKGDSASKKAAQQWISEGKPRGKLQELADNYQITRQSIGQEAKRLEGGAIVEKYGDDESLAVRLYQEVCREIDELVTGIKYVADEPEKPAQTINVNIPEQPAPIVNFTVPELKVELPKKVEQTEIDENVYEEESIERQALLTDEEEKSDQEIYDEYHQYFEKVMGES